LLPEPEEERVVTPDLDPDELPLDDRVRIPLLDDVDDTELLRVWREDRDAEADGDSDRVVTEDAVEDRVADEVLEEDTL